MVALAVAGGVVRGERAWLTVGGTAAIAVTVEAETEVMAAEE